MNEHRTMKALTLTLSLTVLVCFLGGSLAVARQATAPKTADKSAAELVTAGMAAYDRQDYAQAAKLLQEAVAQGATQWDVLYNAACALALAGDNEKALQFLDRAIQAGYRNTIHLKYDVDLISLHGDPRWERIIAACEEQRTKFLKDHSDPNNTRFITADIDRFWKAYDKAMAAPAEERAAIFQRDYIDPGTIGLKDFRSSGRLDAKRLVKTIESHPNLFKAIRPLTSAIETQRAATIAAFSKFKELFDYAVFPDVYFIIGQMQSGGTSSSNGLLMGAEMFSRSSGIPAAELSEWEKGAIMPLSDIPPLVAHESVHFQQKYMSQGTLLCTCLVEGSADFLGELTSGRLITRMKETHIWANARERELWGEFQKGMDAKDTSRWLYGSSGGNGRPVDLGYWIGYKISEAYYNNAADKKQAVRDMLIMPDCKRFLQNSRYADKFASSTPAPK